MTKQIPRKILHFNHKLREHQHAGDLTKAQAVRDHRDLLGNQLWTVMRRSEDVARYCDKNYGIKFCVSVNVFELTVRQVTFNGAPAGLQSPKIERGDHWMVRRCHGGCSTVGDS